MIHGGKWLEHPIIDLRGVDQIGTWLVLCCLGTMPPPLQPLWVSFFLFWFFCTNCWTEPWKASWTFVKVGSKGKNRRAAVSIFLKMMSSDWRCCESPPPHCSIVTPPWYVTGPKKNPLTFHRDAISSSFWLGWNTECHPNTRPLLWPRCYAAMETAAKQAGWGWCRVGGGGSHHEAPRQITELI